MRIGRRSKIPMQPSLLAITDPFHQMVSLVKCGKQICKVSKPLSHSRKGRNERLTRCRNWRRADLVWGALHDARRHALLDGALLALGIIRKPYPLSLDHWLGPFCYLLTPNFWRHRSSSPAVTFSSLAHRRCLISSRRGTSYAKPSAFSATLSSSFSSGPLSACCWRWSVS